MPKKSNVMKKAKAKTPDHENPEWTEQDFAAATRLPGTSLRSAIKKARQGRGPQVEPKKVAISIRLNPEIIKHFKAKGKGWQGRMEKVLMKAAGE
jgi:uncharacterized protein (DUF4415 family)